MSLQLVKNGMTDAVMFGPDGKNILPAAVLYKKNILALRGSFRPVTKVNMDMYEESYNMFIKENKVDIKVGFNIEMMIFVFKVDRQIKLKAKIIKEKNIFCAEFIKIMVRKMNNNFSLGFSQLFLWG